MKIPQLPNDIIEKIMIEVKYEKKQQYYDKCKKWLLNDISNRINRRYYIEILKNFKRIDTERGRYDIDTTVAFKHYLNEELYQYFLDKRVIF
jgi:hypothetical protein